MESWTWPGPEGRSRAEEWRRQKVTFEPNFEEYREGMNQVEDGGLLQAGTSAHTEDVNQERM